MKTFLILCLICFNVAISSEPGLLYNKNYSEPRSAHEKALVNHVKISLEKAMQRDSKLKGTLFLEDIACRVWEIDVPYHHLLNNLCSLPGASHLHVGLLFGGSFIAALYENQQLLEEQIGVDWFQECPEEIFYSHCNNYLAPTSYTIMNSGCFGVDKSAFSTPIDIYFYDADHTWKGQEGAFTYYNDVFADVFVAVVDDWKWEWTRLATFSAFKKLGYSILYEDIIPSTTDCGFGQYIAVIRKSN